MALATTIVAVVYPVGMQVKSAGDLLASFSFTVQQISLSTFYLAAVTLLYWRQPARGLLPALAPMGRMGLTTYLMQSLFGVLQVFLAQAWMRRFTLGPVEWLWRSLTYFKLQPMTRAVSQPA